MLSSFLSAPAQACIKKCHGLYALTTAIYTLTFAEAGTEETLSVPEDRSSSGTPVAWSLTSGVCSLFLRLNYLISPD